MLSSTTELLACSHSCLSPPCTPRLVVSCIRVCHIAQQHSPEASDAHYMPITTAPALVVQVDNEDMVFTLETVVEKCGEAIAPYALGVTQQLVQAFWRLQVGYCCTSVILSLCAHKPQ